jgi:hypothetical protein
MEPAIEEWLRASRARLRDGTLSDDDMNRLEKLLAAPRQQVLYLYSKSTNMRSGIAGWVLYDPTTPAEPTLPSQDPPYGSVIEAMADGWRVVQFPDPRAYRYEGVDNDYLGFEFILEKTTLATTEEA